MPNKIVSHLHTPCSWCCFLGTISAASAETLSSPENVHFPSKVTWVQITILIGGSRCKTSLLVLPILSMCFLYLEKGRFMTSLAGQAAGESKKVRRGALAINMRAACTFKRIKFGAVAACCSHRKCDFNRVINQLKDKQRELRWNVHSE